MFTPKYPVAQLSEYKIVHLRRTCWHGFESHSSLAKICLNFHKMNRCYYLLEPVVIIPLFPNVYLNLPFPQARFSDLMLEREKCYKKFKHYSLKWYDINRQCVTKCTDTLGSTSISNFILNWPLLEKMINIEYKKPVLGRVWSFALCNLYCDKSRNICITMSLPDAQCNLI